MHHQFVGAARRSPFVLLPSAFYLFGCGLPTLGYSNQDKATYLRELIKLGFEVDRKDRLLKRYDRGEFTLAEVCRELNWQPWDFFDHLKIRNRYLNVGMED